MNARQARAELQQAELLIEKALDQARQLVKNVRLDLDLQDPPRPGVRTEPQPIPGADPDAPVLRRKRPIKTQVVDVAIDDRKTEVHQIEGPTLRHASAQAAVALELSSLRAKYELAYKYIASLGHEDDYLRQEQYLMDSSESKEPT